MDICQLCYDLTADLKLNYCDLCFVCNSCAQDLITFKHELKCSCAVPILVSPPIHEITGKVIDQLFNTIRTNLMVVKSKLTQLHANLETYQRINSDTITATLTNYLPVASVEPRQHQLLTAWRDANVPLVKNINLDIDHFNLLHTLLTRAINKHLICLISGNDLQTWYQSYYQIVDLITYPAEPKPAYELYIYANFMPLKAISLPVIALIAPSYDHKSGSGVRIINGQVNLYENFKLHGHCQAVRWQACYDDFYLAGELISRYIYTNLTLCRVGLVMTVSYLEYNDGKPTLLYCQTVPQFTHVCYLRLDYNKADIYLPGSFFNPKLIPVGTKLFVNDQTYVNTLS